MFKFCLIIQLILQKDMNLIVDGKVKVKIAFKSLNSKKKVLHYSSFQLSLKIT